MPIRLAAPSPTLIDLANIRVEGVGGLGLVGAVVIVALNDSRIGLATVLALVFGAGLAIVLIARRRRTRSLPSAGGGATIDRCCISRARGEAVSPESRPLEPPQSLQHGCR